MGVCDRVHDGAPNGTHDLNIPHLLAGFEAILSLLTCLRLAKDACEAVEGKVCFSWRNVQPFSGERLLCQAENTEDGAAAQDSEASVSDSPP